MITALRISLGLALACLIALTTHSAASMLAMAYASGQMVICTGEGTQVVYVDAEGQPTKAPHDCPDCISLLLDAAAAPEGALLPDMSRAAAGQAPEALMLAALRQMRASARAPPQA
jgi:hypothetical protein